MVAVCNIRCMNDEDKAIITSIVLSVVAKNGRWTPSSNVFFLADYKNERNANAMCQTPHPGSEYYGARGSHHSALCRVDEGATQCVHPYALGVYLLQEGVAPVDSMLRGVDGGGLCVLQLGTPLPHEGRLFHLPRHFICE